MAIIAISVFPLAVGAETSTLSPSSSPARTLSACGGYSSSNPCEVRNSIAGTGRFRFSIFIPGYSDRVGIHKWMLPSASSG